MLYQWNKKACILAQLFTAWLTEYFKPIVKTYCSKKNFFFKRLYFIDNALGYFRVLMEMSNDIKFLPCLLTQYPLCSSWIKE